MSHKRKILLFNSCLLVTYQLFLYFIHIYFEYIRSITKLAQQETWTNINQWCGSRTTEHTCHGGQAGGGLSRGQQCCGTRLPLTPAPSGAPRDGPARGHPCQAQLAPPGTLPCPASAQLPSLPCHALLLLLSDQAELPWRVSEEGKEETGATSGHHVTAQARLHIQTTPHVQSEPLSHGRGQPWGAHGEHFHLPHARYSWPCVPWVPALSSTPAASRYTTRNSPNAESAPR